MTDHATRRGYAALTLLLSGGLASAAAADILTVGASPAADFATLDAAIAAAAAGDELLLEPGVYRDADGDGVVARLDSKPLTLRAAGAPGSAILEYAVLPVPGRAILLDGGISEEGVLTDSIFDGLTIRPDDCCGGDGTPLAQAAANASNMAAQFRNCVFSDNRGFNYIESSGPAGNIRFNDCLFIDNDGRILIGGPGGGFIGCTFRSSGTVAFATPESSSPPWSVQGSMLGCLFESQLGSVRVAHAGDVTIRDCDFRGVAEGVYAVSGGIQSFTRVENCRFPAAPGTAINVNEASMRILGCDFESAAPSDRTLICIGGDAPLNNLDDFYISIDDCRFGGDLGSGSAVDIESVPLGDRIQRVRISGCEFTDCRSTSAGAAIQSRRSIVDVTGCVFVGGESDAGGHAIALEGGDRGRVRIFGNEFRNHGDPALGFGATLLNLDALDVQCRDNAFCGDAGTPLGGIAISAWDNLFGDDCWADFPLPRGIAAMAKATEVTATATAGFDIDTDTATGGTSDTAFAKASFDSFPMMADALTSATLDACTPTERGFDFELETSSQLFASSGGDFQGTGADGRIVFTAWVQVVTRDAQSLEIELFSQDGTDQSSIWSDLAADADVVDSTGDSIAPGVDSDPATGRWTFDLAADSTFTITVRIDLQDGIEVESFEVDNRLVAERFMARVAFLEEGDDDGDGEEEEEETAAEDLNGDGKINGADLATILSAWGSQDPTLDLNGDGIVSGGDLARILAAWTS